MKHSLSALTTFAFVTTLISLGHAQPEAPAAQPEAPAAQPETLTMEGRWVRSGSLPAIEARRDAAIERVTDQMNIFVRGIAGRRLRRGMPVAPSISISGEGSGFRAQVGAYNLNFAPDGARHPMSDPFGNDIRASQRFQGGRLHQVMRSDSGTLSHVLQVSEDGQTLTLTVRVGSSQLPADVVYRVRYRRR